MSRFSLSLEVNGPQFRPHEIRLGGVKVAVRDYDGSTAEEIAAEFCALLGAAVLAAAKADESLDWHAPEEEPESLDACACLCELEHRGVRVCKGVAEPGLSLPRQGFDIMVCRPCFGARTQVKS